MSVTESRVLTSFPISALEEMKEKLNTTNLISKNIALKLIDQLIETKKEYAQVARDYKILFDTSDEILNSGELGEIAKEDMKKALDTPTGKYVKGIYKE